MRVVENVTKRDGTAELNYSIKIDRLGDDLRISLMDVEVVELNGAAAPEELSERLGAQFRLPDFVVGRDGVGIGVVGMEELIDQVAAIDPNVRTAFTPAAVALLEETVLTKYWESWVGFWAGLGSIERPSFAETIELPVAGSTVHVDLIVASQRGPPKGEAVLSSIQVLDGEDFLHAIGSAMDTIGASGADGPTWTDGSRKTTIEIATDPSTLRPRRAIFLNETTVTARGSSQTDLETRQWNFDWRSTVCQD